jgi:pimeloyl-ACP methyl ester carboxylesterase
MVKSAAIVLVHGAWADGSSWNRVIPLLQAKKFPVIAMQNPLTSVKDDVEAASRIIASLDGPIVLVGHSWGGMAVTEAGADSKVAALVYVSAFAPDVGESGATLIGAYPAAPAFSTIVTDSLGFVYQTEEDSRRTSRRIFRPMTRACWLRRRVASLGHSSNRASPRLRGRRSPAGT